MDMLRRVFLFAVALTCLLIRPAFADEATHMFEEGNQLYLQAKYAEAITHYEKILQGGYESGELYFNLGNAYYKAANLPRAIINYERAKQLLPRDEDIQFNLQLANLQVVDKIDIVPRLFVYRWIDLLLTLFSLSTMGWIVYAIFIVTLCAFMYFLFAPTTSQKRVSLLAGIVCSFLLVVTMVGFAVQSYKESTTEFAIVLSDVANIK